jgi:N-acetylglucosamine-6-sulfatase
MHMLRKVGGTNKTAFPSSIVALTSLLVIVALLSVMSLPEPSEARTSKPNIVFIYSDDQDVDTMRFMPKTNKQLAANGVTFKNMFTTTPLCCPTRATFLRGQYSHNTNVRSNTLPEGGYEKFVRSGYRRDHLGVWLQRGGYATGHVGKVMNGYVQSSRGKKLPGFDYFVGERPYHADRVRSHALRFVKARAPKAKPFYLSVSPLEPHSPFWFPKRYADLYPNAKRPRTPNFNEDNVSDKPAWISERPRLTPEQVANYDKEYRKRIRGVRAVDDLVGSLVAELRRQGELGNTYFIYSSDNGYMQGAHRLHSKREPYEESIRVPLIIRGPGLASGVARTHIATSNDIAPTIMNFAKLPKKAFFDGRSLRPVAVRSPATGTNWRTATGIEWLGPQDDPKRYYGVRTASGEKYVYHTATGEEEYYDLSVDPYELENKADDPAVAGRVSALKVRADRLLGCRADECWAQEK